MNKSFINKIIPVTVILLILFNSNAFSSILVENSSYGEIFPAENGNMHILIRNDNSFYMYYSSEGIIKNVPLGVSDSSIIFETAFSDGADGVYVLYNDTAIKTLYAQRFSPSGEALWEAPGIVVDTYADTIGFVSSGLTPTSDFIVVYDNYTSYYPYKDYDGYLRSVSLDGVISHPAGQGQFYHDLEIEMHSDMNKLYIKRWVDSYIAPISSDTVQVGDTLNSNILEFDCDGSGFIFGIRRIEGKCDTLELYRFDEQLHAVWETPIECYVGFNKNSSDIYYTRPEIIANNDGSVTLYPSRYSYWDQDISRIDSLGEYFFSNLEADEIIAAINTSDGANLFLENYELDDESRAVRLVKVSVSGDIVFSSILRQGYILKGSIIENTDGSYATTMISENTVSIDKVSFTGEIIITEDIIIVDINDGNLPASFSMSPAYPNPFNPSTTLEYALPMQSDINCTIYDLSGNKVKTYSMTQSPGNHSMVWNASELSSGIYLVKFRAEAVNGSQTFVDYQKITLLK